METKIYKKLYGSILYELHESGFDIEIGKFEDCAQFFFISNKYLQEFCFVLQKYSLSSNSERTTVCLYSIPKYLYNAINSDVLATDCWLRYCFTVDNEARLLNGNDLVKFLKTFKRNKYFYFYHAMIDYCSVNKKPSKLALKKFYKNIKRNTKIKSTN